MESFVVLRDLAVRSPSTERRNPSSSRYVLSDISVGAWADEPAAPECKVEVEELSPASQVDLARDRSVLAIAPVMPTALIAPAESTAVAAPGVTWGIDAVGAAASTRTGKGVTVAVLDSGLDRSHPSFSGVDVVEQDFTGVGVGDRHGHGTHCAGTIFGRDVEGTRIGVARGVERALVGKVLDDQGRGDTQMAYRGIRWAVEQGARVVSLSLGFDFPGYVAQQVDAGWPANLATSRALEAYRANLRLFDSLMGTIAAEEAIGLGAVIVAAAGNESQRNHVPPLTIGASLPAVANEVISVGAIAQGSQGYLMAPFSNAFANICGPGVDIVSAKPGGGTTAKSGTSMACPHVAGVAALWWEEVIASGLPATPRTVVAKVMALATASGFAPGVGVDDRGVGLVRSP